MRIKHPNKASATRANEQADIRRQHRAAIRFDQSRAMSHKEAERVWKEARRNIRTGEVVTSWAGVKT